jgi:hypothetical protein
MSDKIFAQSTKESYRSDIEDSLKQKTIYKNYEYFDDYSYGNSDSIGVWIKKNNESNGYLLYFFQPDGPNTNQDLKKLLEWRRSGISNEIGHKGGGNKRNIYGFKSSKTTIIRKLEKNYYLLCETKPNKLYELSMSDIDEAKFREKSDTIDYITPPVKKETEDLPSWYKETYEKIKKESKIEPNYLIRMVLIEKDFPEEYSDKILWTEYINQVRAKQYKIPIYFKNEILYDKEYQKYDNIDLIGIEDKKKIRQNDSILYIHKTKHSFFFQDNVNKSVYNNIKNSKCNNDDDKNDNIKYDTKDLLEWGTIIMFIVSKDYFNKQLKDYNSNLENSLRAEDFYGVYLKINEKLTNYLPVEGKLLGDSRNNGISTEDGQKNNGRFRMIIIPNNDTCKNNIYFSALIKTEIIKSLSGFLNKSPYKQIIKTAIDNYKYETKTIKPIKPTLKKDGGVYIIYLGCSIYKFGCVMLYTDLDRRIAEHKTKSIKTIKDFTGKNMKHKSAIVIYKKKTNEPKGDEEKISIKLRDDKNDKITLYQNKGSKTEHREYFKCDDIDYIIQLFDY